MTQIQIDWSRTQETKRHNIATEQQAINELGETMRHNVATETETKRHNIAGEVETNRHNVRTEKQEDQRIAENKRHNKRTESQEDKRINETKRHNKATEKQKSAEIKIAGDKAASEIRLNDARSAAQELVNIVNRSNPELFRAKNFIDVLKSSSPLLYSYLGLQYATKEQKYLLQGTSGSLDTPEEAVSLLNNIHKQAFGEDLDPSTKQLLNNSFVTIMDKGSKRHTSKSGSTHGGKSGKMKSKK